MRRSRLSDWLNLADVHLLPQKAGAADVVLPSKLLGSGVAGGAGRSLRLRGSGAAAVVEDGALRQRLGERARQVAEQRFGKEAVLRRLEQELVALVG